MNSTEYTQLHLASIQLDSVWCAQLPVSVQINFTSVSTWSKNKLLLLPGITAIRIHSARKSDKVPSGRAPNDTHTHTERKTVNNKKCHQFNDCFFFFEMTNKSTKAKYNENCHQASEIACVGNVCVIVSFGSPPSQNLVVWYILGSNLI